MGYIVPFVQPKRDLPVWIRDYDPDCHTAEVTLRDLQCLAERINVEHTATSAWATNAGGELALLLCGRGGRCKHKVAVDPKDSFVAILARVDAAVNEHIDDCLGRAGGKSRQRLFV